MIRLDTVGVDNSGDGFCFGTVVAGSQVHNMAGNVPSSRLCPGQMVILSLLL